MTRKLRNKVHLDISHCHFHLRTFQIFEESSCISHSLLCKQLWSNNMFAWRWTGMNNNEANVHLSLDNFIRNTKLKLLLGLEAIFGDIAWSKNIYRSVETFGKSSIFATFELDDETKTHFLLKPFIWIRLRHFEFFQFFFETVTRIDSQSNSSQIIISLEMKLVLPLTQRESFPYR